MLRQIALLLLTICLAVPAVAASLCEQPQPCTTATPSHQSIASDHVAPGRVSPVMMNHDRKTDSSMSHVAASVPDNHPGNHNGDTPMSLQHRGCIGCAALSSLPAVALRDDMAPVAATSPPMRALVAFATAPDLPPPRP